MRSTTIRKQTTERKGSGCRPAISRLWTNTCNSNQVHILKI